MAIGPVQLLVLGFRQPDFQGEIRQELDRFGDNDLVRVIDALAVGKDADGNLEALHESQLSGDRQQAVGALVGGLIGLGAAGQEGVELGAERGAAAVAERGRVFGDEAAGGGARRAPARQRRPGGPGGAPLGHRPARRDRPGGRVPAGVGVHQPLDLVGIGLVEAEEADALALVEGDTI